MNVTISQTIRPVKLAFFIRPGIRKSYLRAVHICSVLWGGACFPILPFYKVLPRKFRHEYRASETTEEFYRFALANFDPDVIVVDDEIKPSAVAPFVNKRNIVTMNQVEQSFEAKEEGYGIGMELILRALKEQEFKYQRTDGFRIRYAPVDSTNPFMATLFGQYASNTWQQLAAVGLPKRYFTSTKLRGTEPEGYYEEDVLTALDVTLHSLNNVGFKSWSSETGVFLLNPNRTEDLILFWNLRAIGWNLLAVPVNDYRNESWLKRIRRQQQLFHSHFNLVDHIHILAGYGIPREEVYEAQQFLDTIQVDPNKKIRYSHHWWIPRFWHDSKHLHYDKAYAISPKGASKELIFDWDTKSTLRVNVLKPALDVSSYHGKRLCYVNEVQYIVDGMQPQYAQVLPDLPSDKVERLTRWGYNQWRFSSNGNFFLSSGWDKEIDIVIPQTERVFSEWFAHHNLSIRHSAAGKMAKQLLVNIGDMYGVNMFANPGLLPILSLFEGGKVIHKHTLFGEASKQFNKYKDHFRVWGVTDIVDGLIKKGIIQAGFEIQCSFCNQHSFYTVNELNERLRCTVCQNIFLAPVHSPDNIKWSYRGLGPFSRNNRAEGIIAVLLTLRFFRITLRHDALISSTLSFDILENDKIVNEVDLALFYKEFNHSPQPTDLFFCECKTEIEFQRKDIERMKRLGILFPGSVLVFATLKLQLSEAEKIAIGKLVKYFRGGLKSRPRNPVLILTGNELLSRLFGLKHFHEEIHRYNHNHDEVGRLCDITCGEYLGLPTHELEVSKRAEVYQNQYYSNQAQKNAILSELMVSLASRS